jgi:hypothetical protein
LHHQLLHQLFRRIGFLIIIRFDIVVVFDFELSRFWMWRSFRSRFGLRRLRARGSRRMVVVVVDQMMPKLLLLLLLLLQ